LDGQARLQLLGDWYRANLGWWINEALRTGAPMFKLLESRNAPGPSPKSIRRGELAHQPHDDAAVPRTPPRDRIAALGRCQRCGTRGVHMRDARPTRSFWRSWRCEERDDTGVVCGGQFRHEKVFRVPAGAIGAPLRTYHFQIPANGVIVNGQKFLKGPAE